MPAGGGGRGWGGRAWGGDLTFFKNLQSNFLPTGKSFQSNATKFPHPRLHIAVNPKKGTIKISPNKTLQSLINVPKLFLQLFLLSSTFLCFQNQRRRSTTGLNWSAFPRRPFCDLTLVKEPLANVTKSYSAQPAPPGFWELCQGTSWGTYEFHSHSCSAPPPSHWLGLGLVKPNLSLSPRYNSIKAAIYLFFISTVYCY